MQNLNNIDVLSLQSQYMKQDITTKAISFALTPEFQSIADEVKLCLILSRVDELSETILDELAWELHIEWYDAATSIDIKKSLIKNSDKVHMYLGTPYAIEQVINDYFGDGYVEEWFQYSGDPYKFKVHTANASVSSELAYQFTRAIEAVKNKRSYLEQVVIDLSGNMDLYFASVVHTGDYLTIEQVV